MKKPHPGPACIPTYPQPWTHHELHQLAREFGIPLRQVATLALQYVAGQRLADFRAFLLYSLDPPGLDGH